MFSLSVRNTFAAAHNLRHYRGKCERLHGHNWVVLLWVEGRELDEAGMLVDFKELKRMLNQVLDHLDHSYLNETPPFDKINPSSENLAQYIYRACAPQVKQHSDGRAQVSRVEVYETENSRAVYTE